MSASGGAKRSPGTPPKTLRRLSRPGVGEEEYDEGDSGSGHGDTSRPPKLMLEGWLVDWLVGFLILLCMFACSFFSRLGRVENLLIYDF